MTDQRSGADHPIEPGRARSAATGDPFVSGNAATTWNPTPKQRARANNTLLDLWDQAEADNDQELVQIVKNILAVLDLPWVRLEVES